MGTNFYLHENVCAHCGRGDEPLHIGKSSAGWCFALHIIPEQGIENLADWETRWERGIIKDEYGNVFSPAEMRERITSRNWVGRKWEKDWWIGYVSEAAFHRSNHSERGPKGLLRHKIGPYCAGHGAGTYDLMKGEFS